MAIGIFFFLEKESLSVFVVKNIKPLLVLFFLGFAGTLVNKYPVVNIVKDITHFIKPILGILIGYYFYKKINNFRTFVSTIVLIGFLSALVHFVILIFFSKTDNLSDIREFGKDNFLELFSLFFLGFYKKFQNESLFQNPSKYYLYFVVILLSSILYFSRTMMVTAIILLLSIYGYTIITVKGLRNIGICLGLFIAFYAYLFSVKLDRNSKGAEAFFYKMQNAPGELFDTKIDRDNHAELWDHWRGYEAKRAMALMVDNPSSFIFGNGHGSLVNLRFFAPLTGPHDKGMKYISELHNGYAYLLYKTGIIGLIIYIGFLIRIYRNIYKSRNFVYTVLSAIGLIFLFTTITITGLYNPKDIMVFIVGAMLSFSNTDTFKQQQLS
ncbi:hypothetical protein FNO01nite_07090 [Flavobacterium noncentrifugens]|nr:hypothetical protein [Flavobacterium noncentrifugens]GEP50037.1 hypothetical protein FNO01nite_07090 [Flavobacterium noncentrifugens]